MTNFRASGFSQQKSIGMAEILFYFFLLFILILHNYTTTAHKN